MGNESWHTRAIEQLSQLFDKEPDARAFVLSGSLAAEEIHVDVWSDVDAMVILAECALGRYFLSTAWLHPFGQLVGVERHESRAAKTLRVCLEGFQRFDLTFISESALRSPSLWDRNPFHPSYAVVWSRLVDLETLIASLPAPSEYQDIAREEIERKVNEFWFKAAQAIVKVVRKDMLIGLHLALDLVRDSLVLQMMRRDREKRTVVHRIGGWGNELATRFAWGGQEGTGVEVLSLIGVSCEVFDELASELLPDYEQRGALLYPSIDHAKRVCHTRAK
jgi:hypothetical protein